ncbi:GTPase-activating protein, putative [Plasmodium chabaudi adami]|uniref:GTPase-activating protein, putative n=1 Tax=Plasmodium chabaudi adami TaxID=5826 RepID=A0A1D3RXN1_PLACE|nr:GTPase-activating protein, putative [Plasmodium chabaudi adami]
MNKYESIKNRIIHNIHKKVTKGKKDGNTHTHETSNNMRDINRGSFVDLRESNTSSEDKKSENDKESKACIVENEENNDDNQYLTHYNDGYLRSFLKSVVVSPCLNALLGTKVISFLNEKERNRVSMTCKLLFVEVHSINNLKQLYKNKFIKNSQRKFIWKAILLAENIYMNEEQYNEFRKKNSSYDNIIEKDIDRTFPNNPYFLNRKEDMQNKLSNILKICSLYFKDIGYCQGMNYVAAILLLVFQNNLDAIRCFIALLKGFNLKGMFIYKFPQLKKIIYQLNILIKAYMPKLFYYFKRKKIKIDFFCINWFMTLFSQDLSFENTLKLWDMFFLFGIKILIKFSLAILYHHQEKILNMSYDQALIFLKTITKLPFTNYLFEDQNFFKYLNKFKVTNRMLRHIILFKKNNEKVEIHVDKKNIGKVKWSFLLKQNSKELKNKNFNNNTHINKISFFDKLIDNIVYKASSIMVPRTPPILTYNDQQDRQYKHNSLGANMYTTNFQIPTLNYENKLPEHSYSNEILANNNGCLGINFNTDLLCGITQKSKIEQDDHDDKREYIVPDQPSLMESNMYFDFNLTK